MSVQNPSLEPNPLTRTAISLSPRVWLLFIAAFCCLGAALIVPNRGGALLLFALSGTLVALTLLIRLFSGGRTEPQMALSAQIAQFVAMDAAPSFTTDAEGQIGYQNKAAQERFGPQDGHTLIRAMGDLFANPSAVLFRLQSRAATVGAAREDVVTRRGHVRLAVHRIGPQAAGAEAGGPAQLRAGTHFLWRLEEMMERSSSGRGAESLSLPMLTASKSGTILFMNEAMRRLVGGRVKTLDRVFPVLPLASGAVAQVSTEAGNLSAMVAEIEGPGGRREIYLFPVPQATGDAPIEQAAFDDLPVALLKIATDGRVIAANKMARSLIGSDLSEPVLLSALVEGLGRPVGDWLAEALAGRVTQPEILRVIKPDLDVFLRISLRHVVENGQPGLVAVLNDATELKNMEAQFVQSQKMQAIGQLAGGVAHDFNNLLTAISGHCDLLLLRHDKGDPEYGDLVQIHQNANRAASLVGQLLAFSRKQTLKPEVVDLRDVLSDLTHLLNRLVGEKIALTLTHDPDLKAILADKRQLEQVIMNLVVNARDAMPMGGTIRVETESRKLDQEMERDRVTVPRGDYVVVRVLDDGVGIAPENRTKIFEPFYTTKKTGEGTGLGLSTAYGIIKQTGGFIFVDSVVGQGTTFTLMFPAHEVPIAKPSQEAARAQPVLRKGEGVVLLVEDEAPVRAFASRALRMRGYTVLEAESAEAALKTLDDPALAVDVFVTDVIMPGMDGPSWVREALKTRPHVKVVFVSGYAEESFSDTQSRIPNSVFLPKPFSLTELTATVQGQIH